MSGFGWDEQEELFQADKNVWNGLAKTYKNIRCHKNNVLHFRDILGEVLDGAQATGQGALSVYSNSPAVPNIDPAQANSQVSPTIQRATSSRYQSDRNESDDEDEKRPRKKQKVDIGQAVASMVSELRRSHTEAFVDAINVLESESKARIFTRLKSDEKRDRWLEVAIGTELLPQHQEEKVSLDMVNRLQQKAAHF
ncbi:hypothetical protein POJ06DRAFT_272386 [Lipomyces tetrasporus]|uniref:Myb/SANT-like domain-containing protein n=1 Tax=Lipomyces tetrasporus TaxID=54092 RepID=A0AAD7QYC5_9ASCO|nr:uncharacterized protein POJ06DRAFT_272386 [Lipomyces tetrasporus]KAJ8103700.1 hypothetical protein POJ06DRAFT_272386 [Lipomyces tetrasporus]